MEIIASRVEAIKEQQPKDERCAVFVFKFIYFFNLLFFVTSTKQGAVSNDDDDDDDTSTSSPPDTIAGYSTADILAAVSDSAEQGIALLSNWFGLSPSAAATNETSVDTTEQFDEDAAAATTLSPDV